jgi:hypothetical protein
MEPPDPQEISGKAEFVDDAIDESETDVLPGDKH